MSHSRNLHGLVDTCFEEGHYESGIAALEHSRTPNTTPSALRIRQLLYIALYPPTVASNDKGKQKASGQPVSPMKGAKQLRTQYPPNAEASAAAQRYLSTIAKTASLAAIFAALPSYAKTPGQITPGDQDWDEDDSHVGRESAYIDNAKNSWLLLKEGFIQPKSQWPPSPTKPKKRKPRRRMSEDSDDDAGATTEVEQFAIVADNAWPVLEWLVAMFERDELLTQEGGLLRHSPHLLDQIPSARGPNIARWEMDVPLEITFHCLQQPEQRRQQIGVRLLTCLVNLWYATHLDLNMLVSSVLAKAPIEAADDFPTFVASLSPSAAVSRFKIGLCQKYLNDAQPGSASSTSAHAPRRNARPTRRMAVEDGATVAVAVPVPAPAVISKVPAPSSVEMERLIRMQFGIAYKPALSRVKFELVVAYVGLQSQLTCAERDSEWEAMLKDGRLAGALDAGFLQSDTSQSMYREMIRTLLSI